MEYVYNGETFQELFDNMVNKNFNKLIIPKSLCDTYDTNIRILYTYPLAYITFKGDETIFEKQIEPLEKELNKGDIMFLNAVCIIE